MYTLTRRVVSQSVFVADDLKLAKQYMFVKFEAIQGFQSLYFYSL